MTDEQWGKEFRIAKQRVGDKNKDLQYVHESTIYYEIAREMRPELLEIAIKYGPFCDNLDTNWNPSWRDAMQKALEDKQVDILLGQDE